MVGLWCRGCVVVSSVECSNSLTDHLLKNSPGVCSVCVGSPSKLRDLERSRGREERRMSRGLGGSDLTAAVKPICVVKVTELSYDTQITSRVSGKLECTYGVVQILRW